MKNQRGQVILLLIVIMTVALAIGLSIVQKSLVDVSTSSKVEQSSRAFSAAEAGIEKALLETTITSHSIPSGFLADNSSNVTSILDTGLIPPNAVAGARQDALELPNVGKEEIAQVWLARFDSTANRPPAYYKQPTLEFYWGNNSEDLPAVELTLVFWDGGKYDSTKWYFDPVPRNNGFTSVTCTPSTPFRGLLTYQCMQPLTLGTTYPILLRARMLYKDSQPIAVWAVGNCPTGATSCEDYSIPHQARVIVSTGIAGETQRRVKVFQQSKVIPPFFDYAIFSAGTISK